MSCRFQTATNNDSKTRRLGYFLFATVLHFLFVNHAISELVYLERLKDPTISQKQIAFKLNLTESKVSRALKKLFASHDFKLGQMVAGKFLEEFQMASDYWKLQIKDLELLKDEEDIELKIKIMKEQSDRWEKILYLARQGEAVETMRLMKNGTIQLSADNQ